MNKNTVITVIVLMLVICMLFIAFTFTKGIKVDDKDQAAPDTALTEMSSPYYENEYYRKMDSGLFEILKSKNDLMENLKHFDFEYYNTIDKKAEHKRIFYIFYSANDTYLLKRYLFNHDDPYELQLPAGENYYLVTDSFPTFSAKMTSLSGIEKAPLAFFDSYTKGIRGELTDGGSTNPPKLIIKLQFTAPEATLIYDDVAGYSIRSTTLKFLEYAKP